MFSFFYKQYFVAISLFVDLEKARDANVEHKFGSNGPYEVYGVRVRHPNAYVIGWAAVCTNDNASTFWNTLMRERRHTYAFWRQGGGFDMFPWGVPTDPPGDPWKPPKLIDPKSLQDVQLTTVYPVHELNEKRAAKKAWELFVAGDRSHTEWYDASADRRWTKLFHQ